MIQSKVMSNSFLSLQHVSKRYTGVQALDGVDFEIARGEVHCLAGENGSGKSTLIKIISGVVQPDAGSEILIDGHQIAHQTSIDSMRLGIEVIYQDLSLFPNMTVSENIALNEVLESKNWLVRKRHEEEIAQAAMDRVGVDLPSGELVGDLSMGDQQLVAICRALTSDVRLLIMDEPTTALTRYEVQGLFRVVTELKSQGIASLFVSHKLGEIFEIAERVTVLRDGKKVGTYSCSELDDSRLSYLMTGQTVEYTPYEFAETDRPPLLEVRNLSRQNNFANINFALAPGEILGITGLLGSGRTELALALFGMNKPDEGEIYLDGTRLRLSSVGDAVRAGIGYVPENRLAQGLVMPQSVGRNIVITTVRKLLAKLRFIDRDKYQETVARWIDRLNIRVPSPESPVQTLSGGNQQRVVLAKWMATEPKVLILDGPTVGIDVAAKSAIHSIIRGLASAGVGVIIISDEVAEVHGNCNRALVMNRGRIKAEFNMATTSADQLQDAVQKVSA
jgi:simple sugar transport system ATP-binding protein